MWETIKDYFLWQRTLYLFMRHTKTRAGGANAALAVLTSTVGPS